MESALVVQVVPSVLAVLLHKKWSVCFVSMMASSLTKTVSSKNPVVDYAK